ncbi:MAG: helix-turn-helix domain-containing protein [Okeania sp. SIO3B3]|nr:helix-turn-helix domain-containing protein [Okeania sp. SIO3B3]
MVYIQHRDKNTESAKLFGCVRVVWNDSLACCL